MANIYQPIHEHERNLELLFDVVDEFRLTTSSGCTFDHITIVDAVEIK
jgi:hypothetical protein